MAKKNSIHIPEDILLEIFIRIPAKSVGKFRCLSKTWCTQLSTKHFINEHTKTQHEQKLIVVDKYPGSLFTFSLPFKENETLRNTKLGDKWTSVLGSCNGLVLLQSKAKDGDSVFVLNPITRQQVRIPSPGSVPYSSIGFCGFGYDTLSDDYKVVKTYWKYSRAEGIGYASLDVYSLKTRVWKRNVNAKPVNAKPSLVVMTALHSTNHFMPFVNGAVHWAGYGTDKMYHILAFKLDSETVHDVELPTELKTIRSNFLMVLKGCLSIVQRFNDLSFDIWMMKDYGMVDSWVRFRLDCNVTGRGVTPICFIGDEELLCVETDRWIMCDFKEGIAKTIVDGRLLLYVNDPRRCGVFVESLVSPEQGAIERQDCN